ncbi:MAG TPA: hypothetical protein VKB51_17460 [bacterium]|nr:hypothetical protein [bacterium]
MMRPLAKTGVLLGVAALIAALIAGLGTPARAASFQVSPTRFEFSLERRFTNFFTVTNHSGQTLRLRVTTAFLEADDKGELKERQGSPYDMAPWIVLNPRRINLAPAEKRVVRFSIRPPAGLEPGEYRTVVFFEELPPRPGEVPQQGAGVRIQVLTRLGVTIYGSIGDARPDPHLDVPTVTVAADAVSLTTAAWNSGNARATLDLNATLVAADGSEQGHAEQRVVLQRGQQRDLSLKLPRPEPGTYRLRVHAHTEKGVLFETELPVTVGTGTP